MSTTNPIPDVGTLTGTTAGTTDAAVKRNTGGTLGKDDFLKLLVGQLQHQDPLAPSDDQQWIGQMAQFSQLEQVTNTAETTKQIADTLGKNGALGLIGHTVTYDGDNGPVTGKVEQVDMADGSATLTVDGKSG